MLLLALLKWIKVFLKKSLTLAGVPTDKQDAILAEISLNDKVDISEKLLLDLPELEKHEPAPAGEAKSELPLDSSGISNSPPTN